MEIFIYLKIVIYWLTQHAQSKVSSLSHSMTCDVSFYVGIALSEITISLFFVLPKSKWGSLGTIQQIILNETWGLLPTPVLILLNQHASLDWILLIITNKRMWSSVCLVLCLVLAVIIQSVFACDNKITGISLIPAMFTNTYIQNLKIASQCYRKKLHPQFISDGPSMEKKSASVS